MAFTIDNQTGKITFGVVADGTHDGISRAIADVFGVSETFNDNFATDQWVDSGTKTSVNTGSQVIDWDFSRDGSNQGTSFDLGAGNVSDTAWVLRFKFNTVNKDVPTGALFGGVVISNIANINTASDFIGVRPDSLVSGVANFDVVDGDNTTINAVTADAVMTTSITAGSTFYVQVRRLSATSYDVSLFSDAGFSNLLENFVGTTTAGVSGLQFIVVRGTNAAVETGVFDGTIDDVQFWNGVTQPTITANNWRMRFKLNFSNLDGGGVATDKSLYVGLTDLDQTNSSTVVRDGLFLRTDVDNVATAWVCPSPNGTALDSTGGDFTFTATPSTGTDLFFEMIRTDANDWEISLYPDNTYTTPTETKTSVGGATGTSGLRFLSLLNSSSFTVPGAIDGTFDDFTFTDLTIAVAPNTKTFSIDGLLAIMPTRMTCVDALLQIQGANGACPSGAEAVSSVLDNIDLFDTQVNVSPNLTKTGHRWTPTVAEVALLGAGITKVNLWHGHTGGSGQFKTFVWQNATAGTSSETIIRFGGTFFFFGTSSGIAKRLRILFDATGTFQQIWLPTAGVEYVIGVEDDFPGTAQTRKTGMDTINGVFTQRTSAGVWTDTVGQDWALQLTAQGLGTGQGDQQFCLGADGCLVQVATTFDFTVDAILVRTKDFTVDAVFKFLGANGTCGVNSLTGLKAYWDFNEASGDLLNQASAIGSVDALTGTKGQGTINSITQNVAGQVGTAYDFTPTVAIVTMQGISSDWNFLSSNTGTWTWNTWVDPDETGVTSQTLFNDRGTAFINTGINLRLQKGATTWNPFIIIRQSTNDGFAAGVTDGLGIPQDGQRHMLTVTMDYAQANQNAKIYVDGIFKESLDKTNDSIGGNQLVLQLGRTGGSENYDGIMDETSVWDRIWTPQEIQNVFFQNNQGLPLALQTAGVACFAVDTFSQAAKTKAFTIDAFLQAQGANGVCSSELKAYYKFEETTGNMSADSLGSILNAGSSSDLSMDKTNTGRIVNGWKSSGILSNTRVSIGGNANDWNFLSTGSHTINIWLNNDPAIFNQITQLFYTSDVPFQSEKSGVSLFADWRQNVVRERLSYKIYDNDINVYTVQSPFEFLIQSDATFHMYTIVIEAGVGATFYRDGDSICGGECGFVANTNNFGVQTAEHPPIMFGVGPDGGITEGTIVDEWSFWEGALSADKITELYNSGSGLTITQPFLDGFVDGVQRGCLSIDGCLQDIAITFNFTVDAILNRQTTFTIDAILAGTEPFTIDAKLIVRNTKDFTVDAILQATFDKVFTIASKLNRQVQFIVDVSITPDTGVFRDVADLIVRVLFEDQDLGGSGLTGRQVVDAFVAITTVELQWGFTGKNSRIRSYLNTMKFQGIIQEDGSDPDWYETIWTLVNFPP